MLSRDIPLRTTRALGDFAVDKPLPHRYGDLSNAPFELIKISPSQWFVADHPMPVTAVYVDRQATAGWEQAIESDGAGNSWTVVNLAAPAPEGAALSACGTGKVSAYTGALIENPADIIRDVMLIAGSVVEWPLLRAECAAAGLRLAGSVDAVSSVRAIVDSIAQSAGAIWSFPASARLYPTSAIVGPVRDLYKDSVSGVEVSATSDGVCDTLAVAYDYSSGADAHQKHLELSARPERYGGVKRDLELRWIGSQAVAESVGKRILSRAAGQRYDVRFRVSGTDTSVGAWVRLVAHPEWPFAGGDPALMVLAVDKDYQARATAVTAEWLSVPASVSVTAHTVALPVAAQAGVDLRFRNGTLTLTFVDDDGRPLKDARVALDGSAARTTNARGIVTFNTTVGVHAVAVEATGHVPFSFEVTL